MLIGNRCRTAQSHGQFGFARFVSLTAIGLFALAGAVAPVRDAGAVVTTPGTFRVNEHGAATYDLPIAVPSGTAGMQPTLSLRYSTHSGNGYVGGGWSLSGLSLITRCTKTFIQDGAPGAIRYDANDRFCLDGQRLVLVPGTGTGTYGGNGVEYRTEIDTFSKVVSYGSAGDGPARFEVRTKDGRILEFGGTDNSRIEAAGKTTVMAWAVNKMSDTKGNYLTVDYAENNATGEWYPMRIDYTGNASSVPVLSPFNRTTFVYEDGRGDPVVGYRGGSKQLVSKRLSEIRIQQKAAAADALDSAPHIKRYLLKYETSSASLASRLARVEDCAPYSQPQSLGMVCQAPTLFTYHDGGAPVGTYTGLGLPYYNRYRPFAFGDFNGDGKADVLIDRLDGSWQAYLSNGNGTFIPAGAVVNAQRQECIGMDEAMTCTTVGFLVPLVGDFNADGYADLLVNGSWTETGDEGLKIHWGSASASLASSSVTGRPFANAAPVLADFNGDGRTDMLSVPDGWGGGGAALYLSNGVGQFPVSVVLNEAAQGNTFIPGDFNGDGRVDLLVRYPSWIRNGWYVSLSNADNTFTQVSQLSPFSEWHSPIVGDYNGDGLADIVINTTTEGAGWYAYLSKGDATFEWIGSLFTSPIWRTPILGDFNGDGRSDIVFTNPGFLMPPYWCALTGAAPAFSCAAFAGADVGAKGGFDVNGDGKTDLYFEGVGAVQGATSVPNGIYLTNPAATGPTDYLASVSNGLGAQTSIAYRPLTDSSIYLKDTNASYPVVDIQHSSYVVTETTLTSSSEPGGTRATAYRYQGAKAHILGRGFLGFRHTESQDRQSGLTTQIDHRQDFPYAGLRNRVVLWNSGLRSSVDSVYVCVDPASGAACSVSNTCDPVSGPACTAGVGKGYYPYLSQTDEFKRDPNGAFAGRVRTDTVQDRYGQTTNVTITHLNENGSASGFSKVTEHQYDPPDTARWILGRLTQSTVTSTVPDAPAAPPASPPPPPPAPPPASTPIDPATLMAILQLLLND